MKKGYCRTRKRDCNLTTCILNTSFIEKHKKKKGRDYRRVWIKGKMIKSTVNGFKTSRWRKGFWRKVKI
jgi:hypothetical protein